MCFAPQRRALFRHLNFQKRSEAEVLCTFWLRHVLRATTACNFSSLIWLHGSAPAALASEPTCRPSGASNHWKNTVFRDFPTFSHTCIFFLLTLSLLWSSLFCSSLLWLFPLLLFHLSILSEAWLLKLPSIIIISYYRLDLYIYIYIYTPVVPTWGGAEAALELYYKTFFIYRTCMRRAPARPCMRALCDCDALFQRSHLKLHTSHFTLRTYTSHSTLHLISSHLSSSRLISALLISSLLICHLSSSQLLNLSTAQPFSSHRSSSQLILALLHVTKLLLLGRSFLHAQITAQKRLLHTEAWDIDAFTQTSL